MDTIMLCLFFGLHGWYWLKEGGAKTWQWVSFMALGPILSVLSWDDNLLAAAGGHCYKGIC